MLTEIKQLEDRITVLKKELAEADSARKQKIIEYFCKESGISIGSVVNVRGEDYRITEFEVRSDRTLIIYGNPRKKDGSFGTSRRYLDSEYGFSSLSTWKERIVVNG